MTAAEFAKVAAKVHHSEREFVAVDRTHDKYGNDISDDNVFDASHTEDVFPY